jgi:hypothetical protein
MFVPGRMSWRLHLTRSRSEARRRGRLSNHLWKVAAEDWRLEERCLMSGGTDEMPAMINDPTMDLSKVFFIGDSTLPAPPIKQYTFFNNSDQIVYPILADSNAKGNIYDPKDKPDETYRGYIGYSTGNQQYFVGMKPHTQITVDIPLVFWDGGTAQIATANPLQSNQTWNYYPDAQTTALTVPADPAQPNNNLVVLWYHRTGAPTEVSTDAPAQLIEMTVRDHDYFVNNPSQFPKVPVSQQVTLINYDVSYVNNVALPVAMETTDNPVPGDPAKQLKAFGWTGAAQSIPEFQTAIENFTDSDPAKNGLGTYYGGKGYDKYFIPDPPGSQRVPAGYNFIINGPLNNVVSTYNSASRNPNYQLESGGFRFQVDSMGTGLSMPGQNTISETRPDKIQAFKDFVAQLQPGMLLGAFPFFPNGTTITKIAPDLSSITLSQNASLTNLPPANFSWTVYGSESDNVQATPSGHALIIDTQNTNAESLKNITVGMRISGPGITGYTTTITSIGALDPVKHTITVGLSGSVPGSTKGSYNFFGPPTDYLVGPLLSLWYSWVNYFVDHTTVNPGQPRMGNTLGDPNRNPNNPPSASSLILQLSDVSNLVPGLVVTGPGIPTDGTTTTITAIDTKLNQVTLSQPAAQAQGKYAFSLPKKLPMSPDVNPYTITFATAQEQTTAYKFAYDVYDIMTAFNNLQLTTPIAGSTLSSSAQVLAYSIGCNVGTFADKNDVPTLPAVRAQTQLRDELKSVLRGVYDFQQVPEYDPMTGVSNWYPNPATGTAGAKINGMTAKFGVYNLNPYVYFVHRTLSLNGYGFSVDDDVANVGAPDATKLDIAIGGLANLPNQAIYTYAAPFGPVTTKGTINPQSNPSQITGLDPSVVGKFRGPDPVQGLGAFVYGTGVPLGSAGLPSTISVPVVPGSTAVTLTPELSTTAKAGTYSYTFTGTPLPTAAKQASATPVVNNMSMLSVLGASRFYPESTLTYTWAMLSGPAGAKPTFSINGKNAAKKTTVTFDKPGKYVLQVTITDPGGLSVTSDVSVMVGTSTTTVVPRSPGGIFSFFPHSGFGIG